MQPAASLAGGKNAEDRYDLVDTNLVSRIHMACHDHQNRPTSALCQQRSRIWIRRRRLEAFYTWNVTRRSAKDPRSLRENKKKEVVMRKVAHTCFPHLKELRKKESRSS